MTGGEWGAGCSRPNCHWTTRDEGYASRREAMASHAEHLHEAHGAPLIRMKEAK